MAAAAGCAFPPISRNDVASYDFGPARAADSRTRIRQTILVQEVSAPVWMDTTSMYYRLAFRDAARPQAYAGSRWVMPPAGLVTSRLRQRISSVSASGMVLPADGIRARVMLRVELEEFGQIFDSVDRSRAVVRMRATLISNRDLVGQRVFAVERASLTPDAEGGARALAQAADEAIDRLIDWIASRLRS